MKKFILPYLIIFTVISCNKIESSIENNEGNAPIYLVGGTKDGTPFNLTVNDTNVFLYHGDAIMNGIKTYYSEITNASADESIKITFMPAEQPLNEIDDYNTNDKYLKFLVHQDKRFKFNFDGNQGIASSFRYYNKFNQPVQATEILYEEFGKYTVRYQLNGITNDEYEIVINNGFEGDNLNAGFSIVDGANNLELHAENTNSGYTHDWYVDNNLYNLTNDIELPLENGIYSIKHVITDAHGNKAEEIKLFSVTSHTKDWFIDVDYAPGYEATKNFDNVIIEYRKDGELYSSAYADENLTSEVSVTNLSYFTEKQSIAVKATFEFTCRLYNESHTSYLDLSNVKGTFKYHL